MRAILAVLALTVSSTATAAAQSAPDYTTIDGIMTELYASVTRVPGAPFEWDRLRAIMLPGGILLPQRQQRQGRTDIMDVDEFITWLDEAWKPIIGTPQDRGFYERQIHVVIEEFGDIAHALSTYEKGPYEPRSIQGRGINSVQLVKRDGRWFILSITWDEENTAGPLPARYSGS